MRTSFVGLVSQFGLESFLPETEATRRWLVQATARHPVTCVWAVLPHEGAEEVGQLLHAGDSSVAFRHMASVADSLGPLFQ